MLLAYFVYISLMLVMVVFALKQMKLNKYWGVMTGIPIILFSMVIGLRYNVGMDYMTYYYSYISQSSQGMDYSFFEPGFVGLNKLLFLSGFPVYSLFICVAFLQVICFYKAFQDKAYLLPFAVYALFVLGHVFFMMNGLRQGIAQMVMFVGLRYAFDKRNIWKFLICLIIAISFHYSALICLPMIVLCFMQERTKLDSRWVLSGIFISIIVFHEFLFDKFLVVFDSFLTNFNFSELSNLGLSEDSLSKFGGAWQLTMGTGLGQITNYIIVLLFIYSSKYLYSIYGMAFQNYFRLFYIGELILVVAGLDMNLRRLSFYFVIFNIMLVSFLFYIICKRWGVLPAIIKSFGVILFFYYLFLFLFKIYMGESLCSPYQFV